MHCNNTSSNSSNNNIRHTNNFPVRPLCRPRTLLPCHPLCLLLPFLLLLQLLHRSPTATIPTAAIISPPLTGTVSTLAPTIICPRLTMRLSQPVLLAPSLPSTSREHLIIRVLITLVMATTATTCSSMLRDSVNWLHTMDQQPRWPGATVIRTLASILLVKNAITTNTCSPCSNSSINSNSNSFRCRSSCKDHRCIC